MCPEGNALCPEGKRCPEGNALCPEGKDVCFEGNSSTDAGGIDAGKCAIETVPYVRDALLRNEDYGF